MRLMITACLTLSLSFLIPRTIKCQTVAQDSIRSILQNSSVTLYIDSGTAGVNYSEIQIIKTIYVNLVAGTYVVPDGKDLFITYATNWDLFGENIYANDLKFGWYLKNNSPLFLSSGDCISFRPPTTDEINLNIKGYLR